MLSFRGKVSLIVMHHVLPGDEASLTYQKKVIRKIWNNFLHTLYTGN